MLIRAEAVWVAILVVAIINGAARDIVLAPLVGETAARALSSVTLSAIILLVTWMSLAWIDPGSIRDAWTIGAIWLAMTLTFELIAGHYLFRTPWPVLVADYNVLAGRIWIVVLIVTLTAPALIYQAGQNRVSGVESSSLAR
jgi:hypothetical protein